MNRTFWVNNKVIIVFHEATSGLAYDLRDYLLKQGVEDLLFISHPLLYLKDSFKRSSRYERYKNGVVVKNGSAFHWVLPEPLLYIKDVFYTLIWCILFGKNYNLFIGIGNLNAFSGCLLRFINKNSKVIYYVIDYIPHRFKNKLVDEIYHRIEKFCAENSNSTWNLSPRMIEGRNNKWKIKFPNQLVVPHGVNFKRIKRVPLEKINESEILYMGTLLEKQGLQLLISVLPIIRKSIPGVKLTIIGKGPYEEVLKNMVNKHNLNSCVEFLGYIEDHQEVENRIARSALAIAIYDEKYDDFSYYADPGKIKNYLGAGIPVIMTDIPYIARQVKKEKCGFIVAYNKEAVIEVVVNFLLNKKLMTTYRKNAVEFARKYDWNLVFDNAFIGSFKNDEEQK